jgi:hypothetical protein
MSAFANISSAVLDVILATLLPLVLPATGDEPTARRAALEMLEAHSPRTAKELCLAAETIAYSLRGLMLVAQSNDEAMPPDQRIAALASAYRLDATAARAERRLHEAQRARKRTMEQSDAPPVMPETVPADAVTTPPAMPPATAERPAPGPADAAEPPTILQAETTLKSAEKLLKLMRDHCKGAPPPHSQAAQQIREQERAVNLARMALAQARRREAEATAASAGSAT